MFNDIIQLSTLSLFTFMLQFHMQNLFQKAEFDSTQFDSNSQTIITSHVTLNCLL